MIRADSSEGIVTPNKYVTGNWRQSPGNGRASDFIPVSNDIFPVREASKGELCTFDSGVDFMDIFSSCVTSGELCMTSGSVYSFDCGQRTLLAEGDNDLPVKVAPISPFQLSGTVPNTGREIRCEIMVRQREHPPDALPSGSTWRQRGTRRGLGHGVSGVIRKLTFSRLLYTFQAHQASEKNFHWSTSPRVCLFVCNTNATSVAPDDLRPSSACSLTFALRLTAGSRAELAPTKLKI